MTRTAGTLLVVDDDSDMLSLYRCWLAGSHEVRTAGDGVEALERVDGSVDAVLLDREMPKKDGVAVARELDRRDIDPAVVMISGVKPTVELLDVPVDDYLRKPVSREAVLDRVHRALAVTEQPRPRRHLLALETRRRFLDEHRSTRELASEPCYQRTVDTLDRHSEALETARRRVAVDRADRGASETTADLSLRESP